MTSDAIADGILDAGRGDELDEPHEGIPGADPDVQSAVSRLLDQRREVTERELLLAGAIEVLSAGPQNQLELMQKLNGVWPGAGVTPERLNTALRTGLEGDLVCKAAALDDEELWTLTKTGQSEVRATASWAQDMYVRAARQIGEKAGEAFGDDPGQEQCMLWARHLRRSILEGIREDETVFDGSVEALDPRSLTPRGINQEAVLAAIDRWTSAGDVRRFLRVCVLAALDPTDTFGTELVTNVVISCVLHAAVARRDVAGHAEKVGTMAGQRLLLDTPVLLQLMGPEATSAPVLNTIEAAIRADLEVVVAEHTLTELNSALDNVLESEGSNIEAISADRDTAAEMARLVENDVLSIFAAALFDGRAEDWTDFAKFASVGLPQQLTDLGVRRREHGNWDRAVVADCEDALKAALSDRGRGRAAAAIMNDAESMAMVWRRRRRDARDPTVRVAWPGAWLVTSDKVIAPAMKTLEGERAWPLTLTVAQLTQLLTRCQSVPSIRELSKAAATLVAYEASESIACRYPPNVALELAHAIAAGVAGRDYDVRVAQTMTLEHVLADAESKDPAVVTARVLGERQRRHDGAITFQRERLTESAQHADLRAATARYAVDAERRTTDSLRGELESERVKREALIREREEIRKAGRAEAAKNGRVRVRDGVIFAHVVLAILGAFTWMPLVVGALLSAALFWERSRGWVRGDDQGGTAVLAAGVGISPDLIALVAWLWPHIR